MSWFEIALIAAGLIIFVVGGNVVAKRRYRKKGEQPPSDMYPLW